MILTNDKERVKCQAIPNEKISDHETIKIEILHENKKELSKKRMVISWKNYSKELCIENLRKLNWYDFEMLELDDMIKRMRDNLECAVKPMIRKVEIRENTNNKSWFDKQLTALKKKRNDDYFKWSSRKTDIHWKKYVRTRDKYNNMVKIKKDLSIRKQIKRAGKNQKSMWKSLNKILPTKIKNIASCEIAFKNGPITNETEISNKFNDFFVESIIEINSQIPNESEITNATVSNYSFKFKHVNVEQVMNVTKQLTRKINKSEICNSMVWHDAVEYIGHYLSLIINKSFDNGKFPECWKESTITPIPKMKNTNKCEEFRPINSMPNVEKIIECIVKEQLLDYFNEHNILYENQSAYRANFSCESALNLLISDCKDAIENGEMVVAVFLDLKRAFETVSRENTANKLSRIGINGNELNWFKSYMSNRKQRVNYNNNLSEAKIVPIGLAQGTQLSVCFFLLYVNDIVKVVNYGKMYLFADDAVIIVTNKNINEAFNQMNSDLKNVYKWLNQNKLKLNAKKTEYMIISKKEIDLGNLVIKIGNDIIKRVECVKYLGVFIDDKLNFNKQMDTVCKQLASKINFFKRISRKLTPETKKIIYNAIILPHIDYCATLYINCNKEHMKMLQKLQNREMRIILKCEFRKHTEEMLKELNWLSINQKISYNIILYVFKIKNNRTPPYLSNKLQYARDTHNRNTRSCNELRLPNVKTEFGRKNLFFNGVKMFNEIPIVMKLENSLTKFKEMLFNYVQSKIVIR